MSPIRVGFIGLSASSSWGVTAHLPYLKDSSKYEIVALCNTSIESAQAAIAAHKLPASTKAYDSPAAIAADPDIDLVVCSIRVDRHYPFLKPILEAGGKDVYCEWPLGRNLAEGEELAALAKAQGVRTMVGLQGRRGPGARKVKDLIDAGRIGDVLSVSVVADAVNLGAEELPSLAYLQDREVGGNMVAIHLSHTLDTISQAVGQLKSYNSILAVKRPSVRLHDPATNKTVDTIPRSSHDHALIQGRLESGALFSVHMRGGPPVPGSPGITWRVYGTQGEIVFTAAIAMLNLTSPDERIQLHDHSAGTVEDVAVPPDALDEANLPLQARNVGRLYEAFAERRTAEYPDWADAVVRHRLVDELYEREKTGAGDGEPAKYLSGTYGASLEL
ncbi:uncharacterized protein K452DRAFT_282553 [Aplosporella prunicola CBS 121167]|uniref:Gfo/Idh/MocA-like oxidoreductase N-terminal domain-containing protein n=1 Tax=Aplosporella prunicola CBS 121167 TaxID=1176127 RepID=A0A6A6BXT2_9PEZI|nr:uncharacterized protein K452DRAFT_282553 [Aplosporella prunicola CBS 121167]KAF2147541.1 hypothetical protein K452DRAFT_282553 [Aplosporella prunicola CBS 121167]